MSKNGSPADERLREAQGSTVERLRDESTTRFESLQRLLNGAAPLAPIARTLGIRLAAAEPGHVTLEMDAAGHLANPMGTLHGGVLCDIADLAMGMSYASLLAPGETFTTLELKINFLRPVRQGTIRAEAALLKTGRTIGLAECRLLTAERDLIAHATSTCMTLRGDAARGR